jgi:hypothetical protein
MPLSTLLEQPPFGLDRTAKADVLLAGLTELTSHHRNANEAYRRIVDTIFGEIDQPKRVEETPWLPVRLFKRMELASIPRDAIFRELVSSGTTGQAVSRVFLDKETAALQTKALARITTDFIGRQRLPMVIVDQPALGRDHASYNARAAGILGFSTFGRDHYYLLGERLSPNWAGLTAYLDRYRGSPILLFGFTFIVWQQFIELARRDRVKLSFPAGSILIHGGGWKRLAQREVSNKDFKTALAETFGIMNVHNYYGMVEQVGSIFFECEHGFLHPPAFADALVRDPMTLEPAPTTHEGLLQMLSLLPRSYPGHSILTEDLGVIHGEDDCECGRKGKRLNVLGRLPDVEIRGCSDTRVISI